MDLLELEAPAWHLQALCAEKTNDPDIWFEDLDAARRVCAHCPVRNDCLAYALSSEEDGAQLIGVWGGLSPIQRKRLRSHPDRLERMRRVRSRTHLRLLPVPKIVKVPPPPQPVQLVLVLEV